MKCFEKVKHIFDASIIDQQKKFVADLTQIVLENEGSVLNLPAQFLLRKTN